MCEAGWLVGWQAGPCLLCRRWNYRARVEEQNRGEPFPLFLPLLFKRWTEGKDGGGKDRGSVLEVKVSLSRLSVDLWEKENKDPS